jgi:hypothetical protein
MTTWAARLLACLTTVGLGSGMHATPPALASTHAPQAPGLRSSRSGNPSTGHPRPASPVTPSRATICSIHTSDPSRSGSHVEDEGMQSCTGPDFALQAIRVTVQQQRLGPLWVDKASTGWQLSRQNVFSLHVSWPCAPGSGTQTYRIVTDGEFDDSSGDHGQAPGVYSEHNLRTTCP